MRRAFNEYGLIVIDGKFIGISLGYDFTSEHEWGIKGIRRDCGILEATKKTMGVACRSITICPNIKFIEGVNNDVKHAVMFTDYSWNTNSKVHIPQDLDGYVEKLKWDDDYHKKISEKKKEIVNKKDSIITAWDSDGFGVAVYGDKETEYLSELHQAFKDVNVTIAVTNLRASNPFAGSALCLLITDRIPKETTDQMYLADKEFFDREDYEEKIGMKKIIKKYGNKNGYRGDKYFCACSPKWIDYTDEENREEVKAQMNTKYDITYWVNYSDDDSNFGHYSVEEIREWMKGKKKLTEIRKA